MAGDASLRELERSVVASPDDGPARLALARALVRAGRREAALRALDLRRLPDTLQVEAAPLAAELWAEALAGLEPAWTVDLPGPPLLGPEGVVFTADGASLAIAGAWGAEAAVSLLDAATGEALHVERGVQALRAFPTPAGVLLRDHATGRLLALARRPERVIRAVRKREGEESLVDVAPGGERVLLFAAGVASVRAWPDLRELASVRGHGATIDWARDLLVTSAPVDGGLSVTPLAGGEAWTIALPVPWVSSRTVIAPGVLCCAGNGLRLVHLEDRWQLPLLRAQRRGPLRAPSLASDRRGLRLVLGSRPARLDVDLEAGRLLAAPADLERLGKQRGSADAIHPHADAYADWTPRPEPHAALRTFAGQRLLDLPAGAAARAWSPDGHALVVLTGERRLALWRTKS